ncbi:MFS transporter [bacterium]|nr:MAG: MFS transporter [bacterium]
MIRLIIMFSAFAALSVLVIGFVNDILSLKPVYFGYLLAIAGLGMGLGALITGKFGNKIGKNVLIFNGFIASGISLIILANTSSISSLIGFETQNFKIFFAFLMALIVGFSSSLCVIPLQTILQEVTEERMRGKVFGVQNMAVNTAMTVPMALSGFLADILDGKFFNLKGVVTVMIFIGILVLLGGLMDIFLGKENKVLAEE